MNTPAHELRYTLVLTFVVAFLAQTAVGAADFIDSEPTFAFKAGVFGSGDIDYSYNGYPSWSGRSDVSRSLGVSFDYPVYRKLYVGLGCDLQRVDWRIGEPHDVVLDQSILEVSANVKGHFDLWDERLALRPGIGIGGASVSAEYTAYNVWLVTARAGVELQYAISGSYGVGLETGVWSSLKSWDSHDVYAIDLGSVAYVRAEVYVRRPFAENQVSLPTGKNLNAEFILKIGAHSNNDIKYYLLDSELGELHVKSGASLGAELAFTRDYHMYFDATMDFYPVSPAHHLLVWGVGTAYSPLAVDSDVRPRMGLGIGWGRYQETGYFDSGHLMVRLPLQLLLGPSAGLRYMLEITPVYTVAAKTSYYLKQDATVAKPDWFYTFRVGVVF